MINPILTAIEEKQMNETEIIEKIGMPESEIEAKLNACPQITPEQKKAQMDEMWKERKQLIIKIKEMGVGAPAKWLAIANSATAGNKMAKKACEALVDHPIKTMGDYYTIQQAAIAAAPKGVQAMFGAQAEQDVNVGRSLANDANPYLANRLSILRREKNLTQKELAVKANMPVVTLQKLENGSNNILRARTETTLALAKALDITIEELMGEIAENY